MSERLQKEIKLAELAHVLPPDDMPKEGSIWGKTLLGLGGLGSLANIVYATAFMKDRAQRQNWQRRVEQHIQDTTGRKMEAFVPESAMPNSPVMVMPEEKKTASLLSTLVSDRQSLMPRRST